MNKKFTDRRNTFFHLTATTLIGVTRNLVLFNIANFQKLF